MFLTDMILLNHLPVKAFHKCLKGWKLKSICSYKNFHCRPSAKLETLNSPLQKLDQITQMEME